MIQMHLTRIEMFTQVNTFTVRNKWDVSFFKCSCQAIINFICFIAEVATSWDDARDWN